MKANRKPPPPALGRPPLRRYRADLALAVEVGAADAEQAEYRIDELMEELRPRIERLVRNSLGRAGAPNLVQAHIVTDASEV